VPLGPDVDAHVIARGTPGFSGADLANLVNEAALLAARRNKRLVTMSEFEEAKDKVMMGSERKSMVMSDDEKLLTAFHEAGHALCAVHMPASDPIHKATIIPRGRALGMVMRLPEADRVSLSVEKLKADLVVAMGGRVAEELVFGKEKVTTGASNDIKQATNMAKHMVMEWGMSEKLGPIAYSENEQEVFLGHSVTQTQSNSEDTVKAIDDEVRKIIDVAYEGATKILTEFRDQLDIIGNGLIEFETLNGDEIDELIKGNPPQRGGPAGGEGSRRSSVPTAGHKKDSSDGAGVEPEPQPGE